MQIHDRIIDNIKKSTFHKHIYLTESGDHAILGIMHYIKNAGVVQVIIPDKGGWITYKQYSKKLKLEAVEMKTDRGVVILEELEKLCCDAGNKGLKTALLVTSFAGYYAEQPLDKISEICRKYNVLLIEDTNAFGDNSSKNRLCNGKLSDIIVGSFGKWKVVNNYHGGFISSNLKEVIECLEDANIAEKIKPKNLEEKKLLGNLEKAPLRLKFLMETAEKIKKELSAQGIKIFHKDKRGIGVVTEHKSEVIDYCKKHNYHYEECTRNIRVNEKAISIELKRIE